MRAALGASRLRLFRQILTESGAIAMISAVAGAALAIGGIRMFKAIGGQAVPRADSVTVGVAIVNQAFSRKYFPGSGALGRQSRFAGNAKVMVEIVGIVSDTRTDALSAQAEPEVYLSFWQNGAFSKHLVVRTASDPNAIAKLVRREVHAVDPTASVEHFTTMAQIRRDSIAPRTFAMRLLISFSILATALALVGIYGLLSLSVGSRVKAIAVRKAVAQGYDILRLILAEGARMMGVRIVLGIIVSIFVGRALAGQLFEVRTADPLALVTAAAVFGAVWLLICLLPATRAAKTDLLAALHQD